MLTRFMPSVNYQFPKTGLHCGRIPMNSLSPVVPSGCSVLHLGWANSDEHAEKIKRYTQSDVNVDPMMRMHYESMVEKPTLIDWFL